jgi:hypothetical protein
MAQATPTKRINLDGGTDQGKIVGFVDGVDSYSHPAMVKPTQARWLENAVTRGAIVQVRPGYDQRFEFDLTEGTPFYLWWVSVGRPIIHPQMFQKFQPNGGRPQVVFSISGSLWFAEVYYDGSFSDPVLISSNLFSPNTDQICGCPCVQTGSIAGAGVYVNNIQPRNILVIQDGVNRAAIWDGNGLQVMNPGKLVTVDSTGNTLFPVGYNETIIGQWMAWSGNRLWVGNGPIGRASDLGDPTHFTEEMNTSSGGAWVFPQDITGMIDRGISGTINSALFVFTRDTTWAMATGVLQRLENSSGAGGWAQTPDFQTQMFSGVGCVAGKSPIVHRGLLYWMSQDGIVVFDSSGTVFSTQNLPPIDQEMSYSKCRMSPNMTGACSGYRDSYVFWGVPVGSVTNGRAYNGHLQVLDRQTTVVHTLGLNGPYTYGTIGWQGVWTGIRPIEWQTFDVSGTIRPYAMSMDQDGVVRIWEAFQGNRSDNGQPIPWSFETRRHPAAATMFETSVFKFARVILEQMLGNVSVTISYKGMRGIYKQIFSGTYTATPGSVLAGMAPWNTGDNSTPGESFTVQTRDVSTPQDLGPQDGCSSGGVESPWEDSRDHAFNLLIRVTGRAALVGYRMAVDESQADMNEGDGAPVAETGFHILPENDCPQILSVGTTPPAYVAATSLQRNAFVPYVADYPDAVLYQAPTL